MFVAHSLLAGGKPREAAALFSRAADRCKHAARWAAGCGFMAQCTLAEEGRQALSCTARAGSCFQCRTAQPACPHTSTAKLRPWLPHVTFCQSTAQPNPYQPLCSQYESCAKPDVAAGEHLAALQAGAAASATVAAAELRAGELRDKAAAQAGMEGMSLEGEAGECCCCR